LPSKQLPRFRLPDTVFRAAIAQLVERVTCNHKVSGSIPDGGFARLAQSDSAPDF
tara:strand:+ start:43 stop:207 length:165 start_codon:yes stop_codon:yes gene_type:complete